MSALLTGSGGDKFFGMGKLAEIEAATEALPPEEKEKLFRYLAARLSAIENRGRRATLVDGPNGTLLLEAGPGAPAMTTETVKQLLQDFP